MKIHLAYFLWGVSFSLLTYIAITLAHAEPLADVQAQSALMAKVKDLGHKALKLGYTCREAGLPLDACAAEYDDVFDKSMAGEPL